MYYSAIGLLAALVLCIVNWDILRDSQAYHKPAWNIYRRFLFAVLVYYVTDVLWGILEYRKLAAALFVDISLMSSSILSSFKRFIFEQVSYTLNMR